MPWEEIIKLIIEFAPLLIDCFDKDETAALNRLRNLGPLDTIRLRRGLRRSGVPVGQIDDRVREVRAALSEASDDDLREVAQMARES